MEKHINIKKVYLFTFISFIATFLFLYIFSETAEQFYTGWDKYTNKNTLSIVADVIFMLLLSVNFIGIMLCIIYPVKRLFNRSSRKNLLKD